MTEKMNEPNVSGGNSAGDAQDNRYAHIVSPDEAPKAEETPKEEPKQEVTQEVVEESDKVEDSEEDESSKKPKKGGFTKKLERLEAKIAEYEAKMANQNDKPTEAEPAKAVDKPKLEDYEDIESYYDALTDWKLDQHTKKVESQTREGEYRRSMEAKAEAYKARSAEAAKAIPDFEDVINDYDGPFTNVMQQALLESEMGPEVAYYLAKNPEQAEKASKMGLVELNKFVGRIEERIESQKSQKVVKKQTNAPEPITPVSVGKTAKTWSLDDPNIPYSEYVRLRGTR